MRFLESVIIAIKALWANKLRSILTLVGMIIGVMTVIAVVSVITGMNNYVSEKINSIGSNTFIIDKFGIITSDEEFFKALRRKNLTLNDMKAIERDCDLCGIVGGGIETGAEKIKYGSDYLEDIAVAGVTHNYLNVSDVIIDIGRPFSEIDEAHNRAVCVIGPDIVKHLIKDTNPLGKKLKIGKYYYEIIGVGKSRGSFLGQNQDNWAAIPITTFSKHYGSRRPLSIYVKARSIDVMQETQDQARTVLRAQRKLKYNQEDDFSIFTAETLMEFFNNFVGIAWLVLILISSISLVVGGIVIMNIMLVSITERTREIGIRKALGARRRDILWQFLVEAVTISILGGAIGVLLGVGFALLISQFSPLPTSIELWAILSGLAVASSVGLAFGIYPATKAARLDPIESLRYE